MTMETGSLTNQEILDRVWNHFVVQDGLPGYRLDGNDFVCTYYDETTGARCAIGLFVPPAEGAKLIGPVFLNVNQLSNVFGSDADWEFLRRLQKCHDQAVDASFGRNCGGVNASMFQKLIREQLTALAAGFRLRVPAARTGDF